MTDHKTVYYTDPKGDVSEIDMFTVDATWALTFPEYSEDDPRKRDSLPNPLKGKKSKADADAEAEAARLAQEQADADAKAAADAEASKKSSSKI